MPKLRYTIDLTFGSECEKQQWSKAFNDILLKLSIGMIETHEDNLLVLDVEEV